MKKVIVNLGERSYPIHIGYNILQSITEVYFSLGLSKQFIIVTDKNVARLHLKHLKNIFRSHGIQPECIVISPGEQQKSLRWANKLYTRLLKEQFPHSGTLVSFGGGVIGDLTGFTAATYRRGITLVHIPTTLLAQIESSIGGKTAVNHPLAKNAIGAFYQPSFVFSDVQLLSTLPRREIISGVGELLKYAYLSEEMFHFLDNHLDDILSVNMGIIEETIFRCASIKARMVSEDERETNPHGGRMALNVGHTIGHVLESLSNFTLRHGEAVLLGLQWELELAHNTGILNDSDYQRFRLLQSRVQFNPKHALPSSKMLLKKLFAKGKHPTFVLPQAISKIISTDKIEQEAVETVLQQALQSPFKRVMKK